jgi:hypothetical protein
MCPLQALCIALLFYKGARAHAWASLCLFLVVLHCVFLFFFFFFFGSIISFCATITSLCIVVVISFHNVVLSFHI